MGAETFETIGKGKTVQIAFNNAKEEAYYDYGHSGYTGTIAEKDRFIIIPLPEGREAGEYSDELISDGDPRIDDKWGPVGCIKIQDGEWLFFGWASS
ncbi:MAG: hypothetical protein HN929_01685 [Chloroflexi bacterium]|jgi:hypothetical protein|nr:hypothetical protein [Chloroflexota bacterium]